MADLSERIASIEEKIKASEAKIARETKRIEELRNEAEQLRFMRYTLTLKEYRLTDDEFFDFMRKAKASKDVIPPAPESATGGSESTTHHLKDNGLVTAQS